MAQKIDRIVVDYRNVGLRADQEQSESARCEWGERMHGPTVILERGFHRTRAYYNVSPERVFCLARIASRAQYMNRGLMLAHTWGWDIDADYGQQLAESEG